MREILFRGKRVDDGEWVHGGYMAYDCDSPFSKMIHRSNIVSYEEGPWNGYWFEVDPETVGQYTGLTDKNGTKIFDGDIVHINCEIEDGIYTCFWDERNFEFGFKNEAESFGIAYVSQNDVEVIGNIHDSPELLTEATP